MIAVNLNAEQALYGPALSLPVFAIPHDDFPRGQKDARMTPFEGRTVIGVRGMSERSDIYRDIPDGLYYTYANEDDNGDRSWRLSYAMNGKKERPGLKWVCPPEKWFERNQYDNAEVAACDFVGIHIGVPEFLDEHGNLKPEGEIINYPISLNGKPTVCLEVESDPDHPEQLALIPEICRRLLAAGMPLVAAWGSAPNYPDIIDHPDLLKALQAVNEHPPVVKPPTATVDARQQAEQAYNSLTGGAPFIPGRQYVQDNGDSFTVVVTYPLP